MTGAERIGYLANLNRCKAQQTIHLGNFDPYDWQGIYRLYLSAYGDEALASKMRLRATELLVDKRCADARGR